MTIAPRKNTKRRLASTDQQGSADVELWKSRFAASRREHGKPGVWSEFEFVKEQGSLEVFTESDADVLRDEVLAAALLDDTRIATLVNAAQQLHLDHGFEWPDLYMKLIHYFLDQGQYDDAVRWHLQLASTLPPSTEVFGALLSSFVVDPTPQMQSTLTTIYVFSTERRLYDYIIPALFSSGQSKLARTWRKKLVLFKDVPTSTSKSRPFLKFLVRYYPSIPLTAEELAAAGFEFYRPTPDINSFEAPELAAPIDYDQRSGQYSDSLVAKWFASTWTSVEFAINLVHRLGLRVIGPRSLQSLALRESNAKDVADRIAQTERLGIEISAQAYCRALVLFARQGEDGLLSDLLSCDIHPDEFDDLETRQLLMVSAVRQGDWRRERLFQRIEWAIETGPSSRRLNSLLRSEFSKRKLGQTRLVLDRMEALRVRMAQTNATQLLERTFVGLSVHPGERSRQRQPSEAVNPNSLLNRAIDITRRIACHDVAIPIHYWKVLVYNLGRTGRFEEMEQLCFEIVQLYTPPYGGLIPVHDEDLPGANVVGLSSHGEPLKESEAPGPPETLRGPIATRRALGSGASDHSFIENLFTRQVREMENLERNPPTGSENGTRTTYTTANDEYALDTNESLGGWIDSVGQLDGDVAKDSPAGTDAKEDIPADLPFTHREHPVQKIFDAHLQRSIVRWGFDHTLAKRPNSPALLDMGFPGTVDFDVACGVHLLSLLRDQGVLIDTQVLRATVISRIALGQVPGRRRDRSRDGNEMSLENVKKLVDEAWGTEIMLSLPDIRRELERRKPKLWSRYPKLFGKTFDQRQMDEESV
ncbi:pentatricopeptide repeat domain-containing protein [Purpureocillium lavendulum]|uniref:Pentatricopeptide repeat domain-containing protein n=1 Tax=Purpureocillium lavendulum TaxID=1247861 RepID=A0AB34FZ57_9HYPO|nr:pentatricopeptide repeat domain-containing protein [Purpureocillium lavendulum]